MLSDLSARFKLMRTERRLFAVIFLLLVLVAVGLTLKFRHRPGQPRESELVIQADSLLPSGSSPDPLSKRPAIRAGGPQQLAAGPDSFDVRENGQVIIADTLQARLLLLDKNGRFAKAIALPFLPNGIFSNQAGDGFYVEDGLSQSVYSVSETGAVMPVGQTLSQLRQFSGFEDVRSVVECSATVLVHNLANRTNALRTLHLCEAPDKLLTVRSLGSPTDDILYVDVEIAEHGDDNRSVRRVLKYDVAHGLILAAIPVNAQYYSMPTDTVRATSSVVYQMIPGERVVVIKKWETR